MMISVPKFFWNSNTWTFLVYHLLFPGSTHFSQLISQIGPNWPKSLWHNAGRRTDFRDKKSSDFSGENFRERNYCPRTGFSGSNPWKILSNQVFSWYGSRAVGCPNGRIHYCQNVFSFWKRRNTHISNASFWKRGRETFLYKCSNSGKNESTPQTLMGTKFSGSNAAPEIPLPKILSRKIARFFVSKISPATGVRIF